MGATLISCLPFANEFEEKVALAIKNEIDLDLILIANFLLPNKKKGNIPKEIDLGIISRSGDIILTEIKGYRSPPKIENHNLHLGYDKIINPLVEMKTYGQIIRKNINKNKAKGGLYFSTRPALLLKKIDPEKVCSMWSEFSFNLTDFINWLRDNLGPKKKPYNKGQLKNIINNHFLKEDIPPFIGFEDDDFTLLKKSSEYRKNLQDDMYFQAVQKQIHLKFRSLSWELYRKLADIGIRLYPHMQKIEHLGTMDVSFLCFTMRDSDNYITEPQLSFHISATDWYDKDELYPPLDHFAIKLVFFGSHKWLRQFLTNYKKDPDGTLNIIRAEFGDKRYKFIATKSRTTNLVLKNIQDLRKSDFDKLYERVIVKGKSIRHIGFDKPLTWESHKKMFRNKNKTMHYLAKEFKFLVEFSKRIIPEYFQEV